MDMRLLVAIGAAVIVSSLGSARAQTSGSAPAQSGPVTSQARDLYDRGYRFYEQGKYAEAYASLLAAWKIKQHWANVGMLGATELRLGRYPEAAEHLSIALRTWEPHPTRDTRPERDRLRPLLDEASAKVHKLVVTTDPPGAELRVDGNSAGLTPLPDPIFLEPGSHKIEARIADRPPAVAAVDAQPGGNQQLRLELPASPARAEGVTAQNGVDTGVNGREVKTPATRTIVLASGAALTVGAAAVGIVYAFKAASADSDVDRLSGEIDRQVGHGQCQDTIQLCRDLDASVDDRKQATIVERIALVSAALVGAATVTTFLLWRPDGRAISIRAIPILSAQHAGLAVGGNF